MSPTSYQTAPPRVVIIATGIGRVKRLPVPGNQKRRALIYLLGTLLLVEGDFAFKEILPPSSLSLSSRSVRTSMFCPGLSFGLLSRRASVFQFMALACGYDLGRINRFLVDLFFENLAVFSD